MSRALPVVTGVVVSSMGCAQLAGIKDTKGSDSLTVTRMSIGSMVMNAPLDLTGLQATYLVPTGAMGQFEPHVAAPVASEPGTWAANLDAPAPVEFTLPDVPMPFPRVLDFPSQTLSILFAPLEHPNPTPAPDMAMLTVTTPLERPTDPGDSFSVYTVGSWTTRLLTSGLTGAMQIGPLPYLFNTSASLSGRPGFDRLTTQDAFLVLRYAGAALTGVAEATPFDQTGADVVTTQTMATVMQDQTLNVKISPQALSTRYAGVRPAVSGLAMNWSLVAAPGYQIASNTGPGLQSGPLGLADTGVTVKYGNPFAARGWNTLFTLQTSESRTTTPIGAKLPVTLAAGMNQFLEAAFVPSGFELTAPAGLPVLISLDGMQLSSDQMYTQPTRFAEVTVLPDNPNVTVFVLQMYDLLPNMAMTALEYHSVFAAASHEGKFEIPPEIFQVGHYYTFRALCTLGGYPGIARGDFTTLELPLSQSYLDSGVITVMP